MSSTDGLTPNDSGSNKRFFVKADKTYVKSNHTTVVTPKPPPKRTEVKNPLTREQREELRYLVVNKWVTTRNLAKKPLHPGKAWTLLYEDGLQGAVNGIEQIEQDELKDCRFYIQQRIKILESVGSQRVMRRKLNW